MSRFGHICWWVLLSAALSLGSAQATPGQLDAAFGSNGTRYPVDALSQYFVGNHVAVAGNGAIYVAGECNPVLSLVSCVRKVMPDGSIDARYATNGNYTLQVGSYRFSNVVGIALSPVDGTLAVAGGCRDTTTAQLGGCIIRLDQGGNLVPIRQWAGSNQYIYVDTLVPTALAQLPNGDLTIAGYCDQFSGAISKFCLSTVRSNATFSTTSAVYPGDFWQVNAVLGKTDQNLWVVSNCKDDRTFAVCLSRVLVLSLFDPTFGANGTRFLTEPAGVPSTVAPVLIESSAALLQPDGKIIIAGLCRSNGAYRCVKRYNADASIDTDWAVGSATPHTLLLGGANQVLALSTNTRDALALQSDGKLLYATVLAQQPVVTPARSDIVLHRINADGSFDTSFGANGDGRTRITTWDATPANSPVNSAPSSLALTSDDSAIVLGGCKATTGTNPPILACLAKLQGGPFQASRCSADIDGDGLINASPDALILARVALGFTGNAVIANIAFASHATRQTWPAIRDYLFNQCGMAVSP
jgi:uncharacterized delta-60 repeat protein